MLRGNRGVPRLLAVFLLLIAFDAAAAPAATIVRVVPNDADLSTAIELSDGTKIIYPLVRVKGIAVLRAPSGKPFILLSGAHCIECGMNESIYVLRIKEDLYARALPRYSYPGKWTTYDTGEPLETSRMFYGRCLSEPLDVVVWYAAYHRVDGGWEPLNSVIRVLDTGPEFRELNGPNTEISGVLQRVKAGTCKELPGVEGKTES